MKRVVCLFVLMTVFPLFSMNRFISRDGLHNNRAKINLIKCYKNKVDKKGFYEEREFRIGVSGQFIRSVPEKSPEIIAFLRDESSSQRNIVNIISGLILVGIYNTAIEYNMFVKCYIPVVAVYCCGKFVKIALYDRLRDEAKLLRISQLSERKKLNRNIEESNRNLRIYGFNSEQLEKIHQINEELKYLDDFYDRPDRIFSDLNQKVLAIRQFDN